MKYWSWLALKIAVASALIAGLWRLVIPLAGPAPGGLMTNWPRLGSDLAYTFVAFFVVIVAFILLWMCAADQFYRCRICVRRLRMPKSSGSFGGIMLGGTPYTEYICTYGHGKLYVPEVHLASSRARRWIGYGSLWENLMHAEKVAGHGAPPPHPERGDDDSELQI